MPTPSPDLMNPALRLRNVAMLVECTCTSPRCIARKTPAPPRKPTMGRVNSTKTKSRLARSRPCPVGIGISFGLPWHRKETSCASLSELREICTLSDTHGEPDEPIVRPERCQFLQPQANTADREHRCGRRL